MSFFYFLAPPIDSLFWLAPLDFRRAAVVVLHASTAEAFGGFIASLADVGR